MDKEADFEGTLAENERANTNAHAHEYAEPKLPKAYWAKYHLTERDGKAVQEILNRYVREELYKQRDALTTIGEDSWQLEKDIDYIEGLAKLFD